MCGLSHRSIATGFLSFLLCAGLRPTAAGERVIPDALQPWAGWATWDDVEAACPRPWRDARTPLCSWPSRLSLDVHESGARAEFEVKVYTETWVSLPGGPGRWPSDVRANGAVQAVVERERRPAIRLPAGAHRVQATYVWADIPQQLALPPEIGLLSLTLNGEVVDVPTWDATGGLWLRRDEVAAEADRDFLSVNLYAVIEDGIPLWWRSELELVVSGKSREEELGLVVPEGWTPATVAAALPVALDEEGRMRVQVRAGKWTVRVDAFRLTHPEEVRFADAAAVPEALVGFRARPDFRVVEVTGLPSVDVTQTTFPQAWRDLPVFRWEIATPFQMVERLRGMGERRPEGLRIERTLWLDDDGGGLTFRDGITGSMQQIWRLDVAEGQELGSVRSAGEGQLITRNPETGAHGIELRTRQVNIEASGRLSNDRTLPASGWMADADRVQVRLHLPPGWRLLALWGADEVQGDWLTAWTLLDLFLLLIFSLAVFRVWGFAGGLAAFAAFGLAYHEPGAPRYTWLFLLLPLVLLGVAPPNRWLQRFLQIWKWSAIAILVLVAAPFIATQLQQVIFPELEEVGPTAGAPLRTVTAFRDPATLDGALMMEPEIAAAVQADRVRRPAARAMPYDLPSEKAPPAQNLMQDAAARIQTGPGLPDWTWREVRFAWNGPVSPGQQVRPILVPAIVERALGLLRVSLIVLLAFLLLGRRTPPGAMPGRAALKTVAAILLLAGSPPQLQAQVQAQFPDEQLIQTLRARLLEVDTAFPNAADVASATLQIEGRRIRIESEIHVAARCAVPLPARLPAWSPVTVEIDGEEAPVLRRDEGFLWVVLPPGIHRVTVEGMLAEVSEWQWTFLLRPRRVVVDAPGWTVTGIRPDGTPEAQVFLVREQREAAGEAAYDRQDFQSVVSVRRTLELGLVWQVRTTVTRLSPPGNAIALRLPLLPGENVVTPNATVRDGFIEVRLSASQRSRSWESGLPFVESLQLSTREADTWVERWELMASPVWNVSISGLAPVFEPTAAALNPVWRPWPGESVQLEVRRPDAVPGATVTVHGASQEVTLGRRQRSARLELSIQASLGDDFPIELPDGAEIATLTVNREAIPVRLADGLLVVPLRPGAQQIVIEYRNREPLHVASRAGSVRLPVESANVTQTVRVPGDRWVLWAAGPRRGPAVRFWAVLAVALLAATVLHRLPDSPLKLYEWMLLSIGLTQVPLPAALLVVLWLFLLSARRGAGGWRPMAFNLLQVSLIALTVISLGVFVAIVAEGLLGHPEMFVRGNGSSRTLLRWYEARSGAELPQPVCYSISIWWYRFAMLLWALWLAAALLRWLRWAWVRFSTGGFFRRMSRPLRKHRAEPPVVPDLPG